MARLKKNEKEDVFRDDLIDDTIGNFNFDRVQKCMEFLDTKWWIQKEDKYRIPTVNELIDAARELLIDTYNSYKEGDPDKECSEEMYNFKATVGPDDDYDLCMTIEYILGFGCGYASMEYND